MNTLHILNQSAPSGALSDCLRVLQPQDSLLLIEDGVYLCACWEDLPLPAGVNCYVLQEDLSARGLSLPIATPSVELVDYAGFVALVTRCQRNLSWF